MAAPVPEIRSVPMPEAWQRGRRQVVRPKVVRVPEAPSCFSPARQRHASAGAKRILVPCKAVSRRATPAGPGPETVLVPGLPATSGGDWWARLHRLGTPRIMAVCGVMVALLLTFRHEGASWLARWRAGSSGAAVAPGWHLFTAEEWYQQARERAARGDFRLALGAVDYALLASSPNDAELLDFKADMHQSLFQFREAWDTYDQVVRLDPQDADARQNLALCRRVTRYRGAPESRASTLYGLHRVMLSQGRIAEALAISQRLRSDRALQEATWQAALDRTGLHGKATVDAGGALTVDLSGGTLRPDLSRLESLPVKALNLAGTGVESVAALRGIPLERLDLSGTPVHDLAPLRGMPLRALNLRGTGVVEISALAECAHLRELDLSRTRVADLSPLASLPLSSLRAADTPVADIRALAAVPLRRLDLSRTRVSDLSPLGSLGLETLALSDTPASDLTPLKGCALEELELSGTNVRDLAPLAGMPLNRLTLARCSRVTNLGPLASCTELEHLILPSRNTDRTALVSLTRLRFVQEGGQL